MADGAGGLMTFGVEIQAIGPVAVFRAAEHSGVTSL